MRFRPLIAGVMAAALAAVPAVAQEAAKPSIVVTTLGTGAPILNPARFSQSTLVEAGVHRLLFDCGRGAVLRLAQAGVRPASVEQVFFTHYHSDHTVGFADFWLMSWLPAGGARKTPLTVTGPTGVEALVAGHRTAFADDIRIRVDDQSLPPKGAEIEVQPFDKSGVVFNKDGVVVTAFETNHGEKIAPNYGYKIEYNGHAVVISGDTKKDDRFVEMSKGVDLLLHEVAAARYKLAERTLIQVILAHHTTPQEAGEVFTAAAPKLAAYTHLVLLGRPGIPPLSPDDLVKMTRETYDGPLVVAKDLTRFEIGDEVKVTHPDE